MRLALMQLQRHVAIVETVDHKASLLEQIDHFGVRLSNQASTGTFADIDLRSKRYIFLKDQWSTRGAETQLEDKIDEEK